MVNIPSTVISAERQHQIQPSVAMSTPKLEEEITLRRRCDRETA